MKYSKLSILLLSLSVSVGANAQWFDKNYVAASVLGSQVDLGNSSEDEPGFAVAFGTQIHRQWYAEIGFNQFSSSLESVNTSSLATVSDTLNVGADASGFYLGLLGKASGQVGELYYRLGAMSLDYETYYVDSSLACSNASGQTLTLADGNTTALCSKDDSDIAGMFGLGFDYYVGVNSQIRFSADHIRAPNNVQINAFQVGFRYSF
ncbi:MAG: outer membrane beta-barrel protein [Alteromonadaceae bacterium]|nr:outer membrane beta-barrel protein [Alteromonadaceae bacterium]